MIFFTWHTPKTLQPLKDTIKLQLYLIGNTYLVRRSKNRFLKCKNTYVSEWGWSEASGKGYKGQLNSKQKDGYSAESEKESCVK